MAITINITGEGLAAALGMTVEEMEARARELNRQAAGEVPTGPAVPAVPTEPAVRYYRYTLGDSKSGVCAVCAQYAGMITDGTGEDGVPRPRLHPNCKCTLTPVALDVFGYADLQSGAHRFEWLESLGDADLAEVIGRARVELLREGIVDMADLYDGNRLIPLSSLRLRVGSGWMSMEQAADATGISVSGIEFMASGGEIAGVRRLKGGDYLIPAAWRP